MRRPAAAVAPGPGPRRLGLWGAGPASSVLPVTVLVGCLAAGCQQTSQPVPEPDIAVRQGGTLAPHDLCRSLQSLAASGDPSEAAAMLDHLDHPDAGVRACAHDALIVLLGSDPVGYVPYDPPAVRAQKIADWRRRL